jgi:hypothetical protein
MAELPVNPEGVGLEDVVAAHLAARGAFVERGVTEREPDDVLELDVVWTDYTDGLLERHPVEVKSGKWSLKDIFKFAGWMTYADLGQGQFVYKKLPQGRDPRSVNAVCDKLGIDLVQIDNAKDWDGKGFECATEARQSEWTVPIWRYSFWLQRLFVSQLDKLAKNGQCPESVEAVRRYEMLVNDSIFFEPNPQARVEWLLNYHFKHPKLAKTAATEIETGKVEFVNPTSDRVFSGALFRGDFPLVQSCFYVEHRARLAIIKAAADYAHAQKARVLPTPEGKFFFALFGPTAHKAFYDTVEEFGECASFHLLPVLWQNVLWTWGGFLMLDRLDDEIGLMSAQTGIPKEDVEPLLGVFDKLFPIGEGRSWFIQPRGDSRKVLMMMPAALRGLGAYQRTCMYTNPGDYDGLGLDGVTKNNMIHDHNCSVAMIEDDMKEDV